MKEPLVILKRETAGFLNKIQMAHFTEDIVGDST